MFCKIPFISVEYFKRIGFSKMRRLCSINSNSLPCNNHTDWLRLEEISWNAEMNSVGYWKAVFVGDSVDLITNWSVLTRGVYLRRSSTRRSTNETALYTRCRLPPSAIKLAVVNNNIIGYFGYVRGSCSYIATLVWLIFIGRVSLWIRRAWA